MASKAIRSPKPGCPCSRCREKMSLTSDRHCFSKDIRLCSSFANPLTSAALMISAVLIAPIAGPELARLCRNSFRWCGARAGALPDMALNCEATVPRGPACFTTLLRICAGTAPWCWLNRAATVTYSSLPRAAPAADARGSRRSAPCRPQLRTEARIEPLRPARCCIRAWGGAPAVEVVPRRRSASAAASSSRVSRSRLRLLERPCSM
mmetsp:Transcript_11933/g.27257  ORF Transcript_11933/g.27257 Transcript_11933/m.27257 type:complete len:208 (-) Transcript_11933:343-966(-)